LSYLWEITLADLSIIAINANYLQGRVFVARITCSPVIWFGAGFAGCVAWFAFTKPIRIWRLYGKSRMTGLALRCLSSISGSACLTARVTWDTVSVNHGEAWETLDALIALRVDANKASWVADVLFVAAVIT